jgi:hypothetical protein
LRWRRNWRLRILVAAALALVIGSLSYAYAASVNVPATQIGDGSNTISGWSVTSLSYTLNANSPRNVDSVSFTLSPTGQAPGTVRAQLSASGSWYSCSIGGGNAVTCATTSPQATASGSTQLTVVAVQ